MNLITRIKHTIYYVKTGRYTLREAWQLAGYTL